MSPSRRTVPRPTAANARPWWNAAEPSHARWLDAAAHAVTLAFAVLLAWFVLGPHRVGDVFTETDFYGAYAQGARAIQSGHLDPRRYAVVGPGFELMLAGVGLVVRDLFLAAELISLAAMVAALVLWRVTLRRLAGPGVALVAVAVLACNSQVLRYGYAVTTDALAMALQAAALCVLVTRAGPRAMAAAGALAAGAFLTRYTHGVLLLVGPIALLAGWTSGAQAGALPRGARVRLALAYLSGFAAIVAPWIVFSAAHGGGGAIQLHHNIAYEVFARAKGIPWDTYQREMQSQFPTPWSVIARDPGAVFSRLLFNLGDHLRLDALRTTGLAVAIAAAIGAWFAWRDRLLRPLAPVLLACVLAFLALVPAFHSERYALAVLPAWATLAGVAFASVRFAFPVSLRAGRTLWLKALLVAIPLGASALTSLRVQQRALDQLPAEVLQAAAAVQGQVRPGDRVLARKPHFAFHAGMEPLAFPFVDSLSQLAAYAREHRVRWLYFSWPEAEMRPAFSYLLDTSSAVPGLMVRAATTGHPAVVYEIGPGFGEAPAWTANDTLVAVHQARAAVAINDRDVKSRLLLAMFAREHERWEEAQPLLEQLKRLAPEEPFVRTLLADNFSRLGQYGAAETEWQYLEGIKPGDPEVRIGRGDNALRDGRAQAAAELWRPVVAQAYDPATLRRMLLLFTEASDPVTVQAVRARMTELGVKP